MTIGGQSTARASRRRFWTRAQTVAWIVFRTGRAVDGAAAAGRENSEGAGSFLAVVNIALGAPHRLGPGEGASVGGVHRAEQELASEIECRSLTPNAEGLYQARAVRSVWPCKGRGNSYKPATNYKSVRAIAAALRENSRAAVKALAGQSAAGPREFLLSKIGLTIANRNDRTAHFRAAIALASQQLEIGDHGNRVALRSEAFASMDPAERGRQEGNLLSWK